MSTPDSKVHGVHLGPTLLPIVYRVRSWNNGVYCMSFCILLRTQLGPMLAPWTLLSGAFHKKTWFKLCFNANGWSLCSEHMGDDFQVISFYSQILFCLHICSHLPRCRVLPTGRALHSGRLGRTAVVMKTGTRAQSIPTPLRLHQTTIPQQLKKFFPP